MEVRSGYKQTEVGVIPGDWEARPLGSISPVATGNTPPTREPANYGNDFLFVSPVDMGLTKHISRTEKMLSKRGFSISRQFPKGSVLFVCIGSTIGKCGIASETLTSNQQINAILPSEDVLSDYLYYSVSAVGPKIKALAGEQAVPIVNKNAFSATAIPLPPTKAEQEAIAGALSDADALIESLEQLIAKKRQLKQGAMQELLTGKKRLPGFETKPGYKQTEVGVIPDDWEVRAMASLGEALIGLTYSPADVQDSGTLVLRASNIQNGRLAFVDNVFVEMDVPDRAITRENDILICVRNGSRRLIGKCAVIDGQTAGSAFGAFMSVFRSEQNQFVRLQFESQVIQRQINEVLGATINQITSRDLNRFQIPLPPTRAEQKAIAEALIDMDAEIAALETKLAKARQLKQGMMQELLTGRIRLA